MQKLLTGNKISVNICSTATYRMKEGVGMQNVAMDRTQETIEMVKNLDEQDLCLLQMAAQTLLVKAAMKKKEPEKAVI
jgi:hypothetical protein